MLLFKKSKLEKELMEEIKSLAGVDVFPVYDARVLSDLLVAYGKGGAFIDAALMNSLRVFDKYPNLNDNWDNLMIKYKKLGLFPKWEIQI